MSAQNVSRLMNKFMPIFHNTISLPDAIGIDKFKCNAGGNKFQVSITNLKTSKVVDIISARSEDVLYNFFRKFSNPKDVKFVAMDLSLFFNIILAHIFPNAKIIADTFHFIDLCIVP